MSKKIIIIGLFFFLSLFFPKKASAQKSFFNDMAVEYQIEESGETHVINTITLENAVSNLYVTSYTLTLENIEPKNIVAYQAKKKLAAVGEREGKTVRIKVNFDDVVVGKGETRSFTISYDENSFATRTGEVWEIAIPRVTDEEVFRRYTVLLSVPQSFEKEAYISPLSSESYLENGKRYYLFDNGVDTKAGITLGFGKFQVFSFNLSYHLENPLNKQTATQVALPPDTAFQKVLYQKIEPVPEGIEVDEDGNWLATFTLRARERLDIAVAGNVQIYASPRAFLIPSSSVLETNTKPQPYWEADDSEIKEMAALLKSPKAIYDFVTNNLIYDYERVRPNVSRMGAKQAMENPGAAICMEFTDLFIALARAAGIPAREVNGYAYTENPEIQPLSLVADVLHAWPEYWNEVKEVWVPVDPTWGATTGNIDYFSKLDLRHFTFVVHGKDSTKPYPPGSYKLGANPQKDVFVSFGQPGQLRETEPEIMVQTKKYLPFSKTKFVITINNNGPAALYNLTPKVYFDDEIEETGYTDVLPPYGQYTIQVSIPFSFLGKEIPNRIKIVLGNQVVQVPSFKTQAIIYNLTIFFVAIVTVILSIFFGKGKFFKKPVL